MSSNDTAVLDHHTQAMMLATVHEASADIVCKSTRPSVLYRPELSADGNMWCMVYGRDLMCGVAGFGATPELAAKEFDLAWNTEKTPAARIKEAKDNEWRTEYVV